MFGTATTSTNYSQESSFTNGERPYIKGVIFNGYIEFGSVFNTYRAAPTFDMVLGARIFDYGFVGFGFGLGALFYRYDVDEPHHFGYFMVPIYGNLRGYFPVNKDFSPYIDFAVGANLLANKHFFASPARVKLGAGFEYKRLVFGIGYDVTVFGDDANDNMGYVKIGVKIGRLSK